MSSIGSTLNSINTSLLNEISSITSTQRMSGSASTTSTSSTNSSDTVDFSEVAELFKELDHLKSSDPTKLKQVLSDAASKLKDAAGKATDSNQSNFLTDLSDKFQKAADTGDLSVLKPSSSSGRSYGPGGSQISPSTDSSDYMQNLISNLVKKLGSGQGTNASDNLVSSLLSNQSWFPEPYRFRVPLPWADSREVLRPQSPLPDNSRPTGSSGWAVATTPTAVKIVTFRAPTDIGNRAPICRETTARTMLPDGSRVHSGLVTDRRLFLSGVEFCRVLELFLHGDGAILVEILRVVRSGRDRAAGTALRRTPSPAGMRRSSLAWPPFGRSLGLFAVVKLRQSGFKILLCNVAIVALVQLLDDLRRAGPLFVALRLHHVAEFVRGYLAVLVGVGCFEQLLGELGSHLLDGGCVVARTRTPDRTYHGFSYKT